MIVKHQSGNVEKDSVWITLEVRGKKGLVVYSIYIYMFLCVCSYAHNILYKIIY